MGRIGDWLADNIAEIGPEDVWEDPRDEMYGYPYDDEEAPEDNE